MTIFRALRYTAAAFLLLVAAACAQADGGGGGSAADSESGSLAADTPVLRVDQVGGFVTPEMLATRLPVVVLYADGRVISQGPVTLIYPGPALPNVLVRQIPAEEVQQWVDRARQAGVGTAGDLGEPPVADVPATRFTVQDADGTQTLEVPALLEQTEAGEGVTAEQADARRDLRQLLDELSELSIGSAEAADAQRPYQPTAVAAVARPWQPPADELLGEQQEVAWPGPQLPGEPLAAGLDLGCVVASGDEAAAVLAAARDANALTPWTSGDERWSVHLRPLLPDENGCADLRAAR